MKILFLLPAKNESWILRSNLENFSKMADHIIIADQHSNDGSRELYADYKKVEVMDNDQDDHNNSIRWRLLDEARKRYGIDNFIVCIDADEMITKKSIETLKALAEQHGTGTIFSLPWIQLWKDTAHYRMDGVWKDNTKACAFYDNGTMDYERHVVINDHTARIPLIGAGAVISVPDCHLLHFQYAAWSRALIKQAWYKCNELITSPHRARRINLKYASSLDTPRVITASVPPTWSEGLTYPTKAELSTNDAERMSAIQSWFTLYGIEFFEPLQIWQIPELHAQFMKSHHRKPIVRTYHPLFIYINTIRHLLGNILHIKQ